MTSKVNKKLNRVAFRSVLIYVGKLWTPVLSADPEPFPDNLFSYLEICLWFTFRYTNSCFVSLVSFSFTNVTYMRIFCFMIEASVYARFVCLHDYMNSKLLRDLLFSWPFFLSSLLLPENPACNVVYNFGSSLKIRPLLKYLNSWSQDGV